MLSFPRGLFSPFFVVGLLSVGAVADDAPAPEEPAGATTPSAPGDWTIQSVGGTPEAEIKTTERSGKTIYRAGKAVVDESLPEGYPRPTPPGAIELKKYPSVRRAEIRGDGSGDFKMMGRASSNAFWPLFKHIKRRDIPMTAPVEMDYEGLDATGQADAWTMSFLYRVPELGETGEDGQIIVLDAEPVTVVSIGVRGRLNEQQMRLAMAKLESWLEQSGHWKASGDVRTLGYNGPNVWAWNRWWEVQIPVEPVAAPASALTPPPPAQKPDEG